MMMDTVVVILAPFWNNEPVPHTPNGIDVIRTGPNFEPKALDVNINGPVVMAVPSPHTSSIN